jgi:hypothetical protein
MCYEAGHHGGHHQRRDEHGQHSGTQQTQGQVTSEPSEYEPMVHMQD